MTIKAIYDSRDQVPDAYASLFSEREGKWVLSVDGVMLEADVAKLKQTLDKERDISTKLRKDLSAWSNLGEDVTPSAVAGMRERIAELEEVVKANQSKGTEAIDAAVKERIGPLERQFKEQLEAVTKDRDKHRAEAEGHRSQLRAQNFERVVREFAGDKIVPSGATDLIFRAKSYGFDLDENGELTVKKPDGSPRYSEVDPTAPLTFTEYVDRHLRRDAPHLFVKPTGTGDTFNGSSVSGVGKPWGKMTPMEKTAEIAAASKRGEDVAKFVATRAAQAAS